MSRALLGVLAPLLCRQGGGAPSLSRPGCRGPAVFCRKLADQFCRGEVKELEEQLFKEQSLLKIATDKADPGWVAVAVTGDDIIEPVGQADHLIVADPFIGVVHQFLCPEYAALIQFRGEAAEHHMIENDFADFGKLKITADLPADFGVAPAILKTDAFGDVVEQCSSNYLPPVDRLLFDPASGKQSVDESASNLGDNQGVHPDIVEHPVAVEKLKTLVDGRYAHVQLPIRLFYRLLNS